jgi:hypothetical protein
VFFVDRVLIYGVKAFGLEIWTEADFSRAEPSQTNAILLNNDIIAVFIVGRMADQHLGLAWLCFFRHTA